MLTKGLAVASEEADKRSWRTLPDEIHLARAWVTPGEYRVQSAAFNGATAVNHEPSSGKTISLRAGETAVVILRVVQ